MNINDALVIVQEILEDTDLNKTQEMVLAQIWHGFSYQEMAKQSGYNEGYVRSVGSKLLQMIAIALGEKVTKNNLKRVLQRYRQRACPSATLFTPATPFTPLPTTSHTSPVHELESCPSAVGSLPIRTVGNSGLVSYSSPGKSPVPPAPFADGVSFGRSRSQGFSLSPKQDWGEAIDVSSFRGRETELYTLSRWILQERCRLVGLVGVSGIGKTALSVKLAQQLVGIGNWELTTASLFSAVVWRSLRYPPSLQALLAKMIHFLSDGQETAETLPDNPGDRISRLIEYLRNSRCLIILNNFQAVLQPSSATPAAYRADYEEYGELLRRIGETHHQSCLVITSQQKPRELAMLQGHTLPVRSLQLTGLDPLACQEILQVKGLTGTADSVTALIAACHNNPLALKIAATTVQDHFNGDIREFLRSQKQAQQTGHPSL